ncbi:hypothetical protein R6Q57_020755 [Mikania cordata]
MRAPLGVAAPSPPRGQKFYAQLQQNQNFQHLQPNFQPPPNFQPGFAAFSQPRFESDFMSPSQPENEVVPKTQDTLKRKKGKKNKQPVGAGPSSGPMAPKQWTPDEETALGRCFMDESENKTKGNSQKRENFWEKVTQLRNNRKSGMSDENVLKWAEKEYQLKSNGQTFNHYHVWVAIKDSPKFRVLCQEGYEDDEEEESEFDTPPKPVRPMGRDKAKRASSSSRQTGYSNPTTTELADQLQAFTSFQKQKHEDRKKYTKIEKNA